tara:strand:- start:748 stop:1092 length:345 start_codon:yes stop_codon:yes gene_type:complete
MKTSSAKAKGRRLQQWIRDRILDMFPNLTKNDVESVAMGQSGADIKLSEAARKAFPYSVEAKNQEAFNIWKALEQSEKENRDLTPIVVFKRNRSDVYVALRFDDFMNMVEERKG